MALVAAYARKNINTEWFNQNKSIRTFGLSYKQVGINYQRLAALLKPACLDYRYSDVVLLWAVAYALAEELTNNPVLFDSDIQWKKFCAKRNLKFKLKPDWENVCDDKWWRQYLKKALKLASNSAEYIRNDYFNTLPDSIYQEEQRLRKSQARTFDNVIVDLKYKKRFSETSQNLARLKGIFCDLALDQVENKIYLITVRLPNKYHKSRGKDWQFYDPNSSSEQLHKFIKSLRNPLKNQAEKDGVQAYFAYSIEPHEDGTPHLHILVAYHNLRYLQLVLNERYTALFSNINNDSIVIKDHTDAPRTAVNYLLKTYWSKPFQVSREEAWRKAYAIRSFGLSSLNIKLPTLKQWNEARKGSDADCNQNIPASMCTAAAKGNYAQFCREFAILNNRKHRFTRIYTAIKLIVNVVKTKINNALNKGVIFFKDNKQKTIKYINKIPYFGKVTSVLKQFFTKIVKPDKLKSQGKIQSTVLK